jgi:hypothetical protein
MSNAIKLLGSASAIGLSTLVLWEGWSMEDRTSCHTRSPATALGASAVRLSAWMSAGQQGTF